MQLLILRFYVEAPWLGGRMPDTCDLLVAALSNRTGATMTIYQYREESKRHAPITPTAWRRLDVIPMYTSTWHEEESDSVLTCDREIRMPGRNCVAQTYIILLVYVLKVFMWRRRGSAVECRTLEREPGSNPLHMMATLMATRCGDNKIKSL